MRWWRRIGLVVAAAALVAASAGSPAGTGSPRGGQANHRAAKRVAQQLLQQVVLPAGAVAAVTEPQGDGRYLSRPGQIPAETNLVDRHRWWTIAQDETDVSNFVRAHQPKGTRRVTDGVGDGPFPTESLSFALPSGGPTLGTRWLVVEMIALRDGQTGVRADAEVQWLVPRPAGERIPRSARSLEVTVRRPPGPMTSDVVVTSRARIRRIASLIDGLRPLAPGAIDCAGQADDPIVTFTFRAAGRGRVLARATQTVTRDTRVPACEPMALSIRGRVQTPLLGGVRVVRVAQRLLGIDLTRR